MFENRNRWQVKIEQKWSNLIKIVEVDQNCLNSNFLITICEKTKIKKRCRNGPFKKNYNVHEM